MIENPNANSFDNNNVLVCSLYLFIAFAGRPLFHVCLHLFQEYNLIDIFQLDIVKLMRCFSE